MFTLTRQLPVGEIASQCGFAQPASAPSNRIRIINRLGIFFSLGVFLNDTDIGSKSSNQTSGNRRKFHY